MGLYEWVSGGLTVLGYSLLVYRIVELLGRARVRGERLERLCTKWLVFMIFLRVEYYLLVVFDILPLGRLLLLLLKFFLLMPENSISHSIYKRIHRSLERVKLEEYRSHSTVAVSLVSTLGVNLLLRGACRLAALVDCAHIEEVERRILDIIKVLEYRRTAIAMRAQAPPSHANQDLNASEFNSSQIEESPRDQPRHHRSPLGARMNRLLVGEEDGCLRAKVEVMVAKPDRAAGKRARYARVEAEYNERESRLRLSSRGGEESWRLSEIRWITKDMLNIEAVFAEGGSRILRLRDPNDVVRWIEPICARLQPHDDPLDPQEQLESVDPRDPLYPPDRPDPLAPVPREQPA